MKSYIYLIVVFLCIIGMILTLLYFRFLRLFIEEINNTLTWEKLGRPSPNLFLSYGSARLVASYIVFAKCNSDNLSRKAKKMANLARVFFIINLANMSFLILVMVALTAENSAT